MPISRTLPWLLVILALAGAAAPATDALASNDDRGRGQGERTVDERAISLDEAVARAERRYRARAVRAEEQRLGDRVVYRIRLLADDGRVFEVRIDAASGRED